MAGSEVKSIRNGHATIHESYVRIRNNEAYLINATIQPYAYGNRYNPPTSRDRKLLLNRREITKITQLIERKGLVAIPLKIYLKKNVFKVEVGIGVPKKMHDKRASIKERDVTRALSGRSSRL